MRDSGSSKNGFEKCIFGETNMRKICKIWKFEMMDFLKVFWWIFKLEFVKTDNLQRKGVKYKSSSLFPMIESLSSNIHFRIRQKLLADFELLENFLAHETQISNIFPVVDPGLLVRSEHDRLFFVVGI